MDEMMIEPKIELKANKSGQILDGEDLLDDEIDDAERIGDYDSLFADEQIEELDQLSDDVRAFINNSSKIIESSKADRRSLDFTGTALTQHIKALGDAGVEYTSEYLDLIAEKLQCDSWAFPDLRNDELNIIVYNYAFDSVESWESSESYQIFSRLADEALNIVDDDRRNDRLDHIDMIREMVISPIRRYYEELEVGSDAEVVILYDDDRYSEQVGALIGDLSEMDQCSAVAFNISAGRHYDDAKLLSAMHSSSLMICFCQSCEEGAEKFRTKQYIDMKSSSEDERDDKKRLFITDSDATDSDLPFVSLAAENWLSEANGKVSALMGDGAASRKILISKLTLREEKIQSLFNKAQRSPEEAKELAGLIDEQINDMEEYSVLYGDECPCRYDEADLEELGKSIVGERKYIEGNIKRWLGKMIRDDKAINKILGNTNPKRFYERYMQLCKLIDAQQEHRDKLIASGITLDQLSNELLPKVEIGRLELHGKRWEYQRLFKETIINKYMIPFEREFMECRTIDSIKPLKIDNHIENYDKFAACGINLNKSDGLNYWTRHAFTHALNEKKYQQHIIDQQLDRIMRLSETIDHMVRDCYNPNFSKNELKKKAGQITELVQEFEERWGLKLVNKKMVYGGYKSKLCFAKYVDKDLLERDVSSAIEKGGNVNLIELFREYRARSNRAMELCALGDTYRREYNDKKTDKSRLIGLANENYQKAADMGDRKAQYRLAQHYEKGYELTQDINMALAYYRMSAENDFAPAQYRLAVYYKDKGDEPKALEWYLRAADHRRNPHFDACMYLGYYYNRSDKLVDKKAAVKYFLLAKDNIPVNREISDKIPCYLLGVEYKSRKNYTEAISWFEKIAGNSLIADVYCGDCYYMLGKYDKAIEKYKNLDKDKLPDDRKIALGDYLLGNGKVEEAYEYYSKCKNVDSDPKLRGKIADYYLAKGDVEGAKMMYIKCIEEDGSLDLTRKKKLADIYFDEKNYTAALGYYLDYSESFSYDEKVTELIGDCYYNEDEEDNAFKAYLKCLDSIADVQKRLFVFNMLIKNGDGKRAFDLIDDMIRSRSLRTVPEEIINYISAYNRWADLAKWYSEYGCSLPDLSLLCDLGNYYRFMSDDRAVACYEKYVQYHNLKDMAIINYMIRYYKGVGSSDEASIWLERRNNARLG